MHTKLSEIDQQPKTAFYTQFLKEHFDPCEWQNYEEEEEEKG